MKSGEKKKIMIIGAGPAQLMGILHAQKMGYEVIAIDGDKKAPGLKHANIGIELDVKDADSAVEIARQQQVSGVVSIASEISLHTTSVVAKELGLPGLSPEDVAVVTNKAIMRQRYSEHNVPSTEYFVLSDESDIKRAVSAVGLPAVIKPIDSSGSRGVYYVESIDRVRDVFSTVKKHSRLDQVILERFIRGIEVAVEAFVINGEIHIIALSDKERTDPPHLLDISVTFPSSQPEHIQEAIKKTAIEAICALGIDNCPVHMEQMISPDGPRMVELAARGPGFKVFTDMIPHVTGLNLVEIQLCLAMGKPVSFAVDEKQKGASIRFFSGHAGVLRSISGVEKVRLLPFVHDLDIYVEKGEKVRELTSGSDRIGHVITLAETRGKAYRAALEVSKMIQFDIE